MTTIPTVKEIEEQIMADIEAADTSIPLLWVSSLEIIATVFSGVLYLGYKLGAWCYNQILTSSMGRAALLRRGERYGLTLILQRNVVLFALVQGLMEHWFSQVN